MQRPTFSEAAATVLNDPALREIYYEQVKTQRAALSEPPAVAGGPEAAAGKTERMKALHARIGYTPKPDADPLLTLEPAEAWMAEQNFPRPEDAATRGECQQLVLQERARLKAARERLREVGIR
jgi:hypothetical protein